MPEVADLKVKISLDGADKVTKGLKQAGDSIASFGTNAGKLGGAVGSVATQFAALGALAGGSVVTGLGAAVATASTFEASMSRVKAAADASATEMSALGAAALALGSDTQLAGIGATDAATAMEELAKGGVSVADQLGGATKGALLLASSGGIAVADAASLATKAMNIFGLGGADVARVADLLSAAANKSATDVSALGLAFNQSAAVAKNAGLDIGTLTGTLAFLAQRGLEGSDAGTSLKTALLALQAPTDVAAKTMSDLGINVRDAQGEMLPFADIADVLRSRLADLSAAQRDAALKTIFGQDAIRVGIALYEGGGAAIRDWTSKVDDAGNAARTGATINDNLKGSLSQLGAVAETGAIQFGSKFTPLVRTATDELARFLQQALDSPGAQAALDRFVADANTALTEFFTTVKDPAFQESAREWATAALTTGQAVVGLGRDVATLLGPPLREAVTWFNGLDQAGKQQVLSFGLVAASAIKFRDELGTLKTVVYDVITSFAAKEAAKKSLTAANVTLAGSAGGTATAFGGVTAAATAATLAIVVADQVQQKFGEQNDILAQNQARWDAASIAIANGATAENGMTVYFQKWLDVHGQTITSLTQGQALWNQYVASLDAAGISTAGLTTAQLGMLGPAADMNSRLGEGALAGAGFNDTLVGLSVGVDALAATLPALATGLTAGAGAMGDVAARSTTMGSGLGTAAANLGATTTATDATASSLIGVTSAFGGSGLAAGAFGAAIASAQGMVENYDAVLQGLGATQGRLQGYLTTLQGEWDSLTAAVATQGGATADQQARIDALTPAIGFLNASLGANTTQTRDATLAAVNQMIATNDTTGAANAAASAFQSQGLATGAMVTGQLIAQTAAANLATNTNTATTAIANATTATATYTSALQGVPPTVVTTVTTPGAPEAATAIAGVTEAVNAVPRSFTVTANVDISGALANIATLSNNMPRSPAKEGPFRVLPNWQAVFDSFGPAVTGALGQVAQLGAGIDGTLRAAARPVTRSSLAPTLAPGVGWAGGAGPVALPLGGAGGGVGAGLAPIVVNLNAPTYGVDQVQDVVVRAVIAAQRRGRL